MSFLKEMHSDTGTFSAQRCWGSFVITNAVLMAWIAYFAKGEKLTDVGMFLGGLITIVLVNKGLQSFAENGKSSNP